MILADAYMTGGRNARINTTPGRSVQFFGGRAQVVDGRDMPVLMQREDVKLYPKPEAMPWATEWLGRLSRINAEVFWPEGWQVEHINQDEFYIDGPEGLVGRQPEASEQDPPAQVDMTDRQPWISPEDLLDSSEEESEKPVRVRRPKKA